MHKTRRGQALLATAALLFLLAYLFNTVAPALLAVLFLGHLVFARARFAGLLADVHVEVRRDQPAETPHQGDAVLLRATALVGPPGLRVEISDPGASDVTVREVRADLERITPSGLTFAIQERVVPERRGRHRLPAFEVRVQDPDALYEHVYNVEAPLEFSAHAPKAAYRQGRALRQLQAVVTPRRTDPGEWSDEVLALREYVPSDLLRAVDWKASSRFDELLTRTFLREIERPLLLFLDAGASMRLRGQGISMLDHSAEIATAFLGAALRAGVPAGFVAHDEHRTLELVRPARDPTLPRVVARAIAELPAPIDLPEGTSPYAVRTPLDEMEARPDPTPFERGVTPFLGGRRARRLPHGLARALHTAAPGGAPASVVALTDLAHDPDRTVAALAEAVRHQHQVTVIAPFAAWYHLDVTNLEEADAEAVVAAWQTRQRTIKRLEAAGARVLDLAPRTAGRDLVRAHGRAGP